MALRDYIMNGKVLVRREVYAIIKAKASMPGALAVICDDNEITIVIDQSKIQGEQVMEIERDWRLLTFDMILPLDLVGFLAKVLQVLADEGITIFSLWILHRPYPGERERHWKSNPGTREIGFYC